MRTPKIEQYDLDKLHEAKRLLVEVMEYYHGTPGYDSIVNRLGTIVQKIQFLDSEINMEEEVLQ